MSSPSSRARSRLEKAIREFQDLVAASELSSPSNARGMCRSVSSAFARFAATQHLNVTAVAELQFRYLDARKIAFRHRAVLVENVVVDWTANQFFKAPVPAVFENLDEWVALIDESQEGRYEWPDVVMKDATCR